MILTPSNNIDPKLPNKKKDTLQSIIDKVNERFSGNFTDSDRVIIEGIYQMFIEHFGKVFYLRIGVIYNLFAKI